MRDRQKDEGRVGKGEEGGRWDGVLEKERWEGRWRRRGEDSLQVRVEW